MIEQFSQKTQEELKSYVYILIDPRDNKIFYVGKGYGNRVFSHINEAIFNPVGTEKLEIIRAIKQEDLKVKHFIVRHGLEENEALIVEAVLIDFLTFKDFVEVAKISNIVAGHYSFNQGIKTVNECEILYNCEVLKKEDIKHNVLVININKTYDNKRKKKSENPIYDRPNIYEATRGWWVLDKNRAENSDFVLAEYKGVIRAIFKPEKWVQDIENRGVKRWGFEGSEVTSKEILDIYMNKEVPKIRGMANPIRYFEKIATTTGY
ncbi:LEM-3-like GIY-YIG domain-containing protein [Sphingobacterium multivorum]|uniref:LEM-3-like GIY-YIG domain-containing protein n=1 Tax=Sphingobacterium multivorum TaxID=28454 RepID=UPI0028B18F8A|nr:excinuclease ABC [Sphingobacterium multivorum]